MSNKERQQRFREKRDSDPVKRVEYLAKRREKVSFRFERWKA